MTEQEIQDDTCPHKEEKVISQEIALGVNLLGKQTFAYMETLQCLQCKKKRKRRISKEEYENQI